MPFPKVVLLQRVRRIAGELAIVLVLVLVGTVVWDRLLPTSVTSGAAAEKARNRPVPVVGEKLAIASSSLGGRELSVVLLTSPDCPFCKNAAPFHAALLGECARQQIPMYIVVPNLQRARSYLESAGLELAEIKTWKDLNLDVEATPTLLFIGTGGTIERMWIGALTAKEKAEVLDIVHNPERRHIAHQSSSGDLSALDPTRTEAQPLSRDGAIVVVDTRERDDFGRHHNEGAINIPLSELSVRAQFELDASKKHAVDCSSLPADQCDASIKMLADEGISASSLDRGLTYVNSCKVTKVQ